MLIINLIATKFSNYISCLKVWKWIMRFLNSLQWMFETNCFCFPAWNLWSTWPASVSHPASQKALMLSSLQRWYRRWRRGNLIRLVCMANLPGQSPTPLRIYCPGNRHRQYCYCISTWIVNIVIASPPELSILLLHLHLNCNIVIAYPPEGKT